MDNVPRVVPYDGTLELDGTAYSGTVDMRFTMHDAANGGTQMWQETWDSTTAQVNVYGGRFSVLLGSHTAIASAITEAEPLYVSVEVKDSGASSWTALAGRQQVGATPFAMWSSVASDFDVAGDLLVQDPAVTTAGVTISNAGTVTATGAVSGSSLSAGSGLVEGGTLDISGTADLGQTDVTGDINVSDDLEVGDDAFFGSNFAQINLGLAKTARNTAPVHMASRSATTMTTADSSHSGPAPTSSSSKLATSGTTALTC